MEKIIREDVIYDAIEETTEWRNILKNALLENSNKVGISNNEIENLLVQESLHMTLKSYGPKSRKGQLAEEKKEIQLNNFELGKEVYLQVTDIGILEKDGEILNIAFKINENYFSDENLGAGRTLKDLSSNDTPHISYFVNTEIGAKAVNSQKCFGDESVSVLENGESFRIIKLENPLDLKGISVAHKFNIIANELEGFPRDYERFSSQMTNKEIEESKNFKEFCIEKYKSNNFEL